MIVKICGLRTQDDMDNVARGAQMCGLIFAPTSPRAIRAEEAACLNSHAMLRVGVFTDNDLAAIQRTVRVARLDMVQLHGKQSQDMAHILRAMPSGNSPGQSVPIIRVLWPALYKDVQELETSMRAYAPSSDYFLLDAGVSGGGTGQVLAWEHLRGLRSTRPWILAGGLHGGNVREAWHSCAPDGVDCNSQLEDPKGHKDAHKIAAVFEALKG